MNLADILKSYSARVLPHSEAAHYVGNETNLAELERGFGLRPIKQNGRSKFYDVRALDLAIDRASQEGWPKVQV